jgi:hypothetical protein
MTIKRILATGTLALGTALISPTAFARSDVSITVGSMPPAPQVAPGPIGVAPGPGYVWTNGYWDWNGGNWVWVGGQWLLPPHGHHVWVEPYYHEAHGHFQYRRGHWR